MGLIILTANEDNDVSHIIEKKFKKSINSPFDFFQPLYECYNSCHC
jgi:hypothetical protein